MNSSFVAFALTVMLLYSTFPHCRRQAQSTAHGAELGFMTRELTEGVLARVSVEGGGGGEADA